MSLLLVIEDKAAAEIADANNWYAQKSSVAAINFEREIVETVDRLKTNTIEHHQVIPGVRVCPLKTFPYNIYYRVQKEENTIQLIAVLHSQRATDFIKKGLMISE